MARFQQENPFQRAQTAMSGATSTMGSMTRKGPSTEYESSPMTAKDVAMGGLSVWGMGKGLYGAGQDVLNMTKNFFGAPDAASQAINAGSGATNLMGGSQLNTGAQVGTAATQLGDGAMAAASEGLLTESLPAGMYSQGLTGAAGAAGAAESATAGTAATQAAAAEGAAMAAAPSGMSTLGATSGTSAAGAGGMGAMGATGLAGGAGLVGGLGGAMLGKELFGDGVGKNLSGTAGGAAAGAAVGSVVPVLGTAVGAVVGGITGTISSFFV